MTTPTHYCVLQVAENASIEVIHAAWKALQRRYHPDGATGDADMSKRINHAHDVLSDPKQRTAYDQEIAAQRQFEAATQGFSQAGQHRRPFNSGNWANYAAGYSTHGGGFSQAAYPDPMYSEEHEDGAAPQTVEDFFRMGMSNAGFHELAHDLSKGMTEQVIGLIYHRLSPPLREAFLRVVNQYRSANTGDKRRAG